MTDHTMPTRRWGRRAVLAGVVCLVAVMLLTLVVHTPPVRRAVLRRVVVTLADRFDLALEADALQYDLLRRRVVLTGLEMAAVASPQTPFLTADRLEITVPPSALYGRFAIDRLHLGTATLHVLRRSDGTLNLPEAEGGGEDERQELPVARIDAASLTVRVTDETQDLSLLLPAIRLDVGRESGELQMEAAGRFALGDTTTTIESLGGGVAFDGRSIALTRFAAGAPEGTLQLDGTVGVLENPPVLDVEFSGTGDVTAVARWATGEDLPSGLVAIDGSIEGTLDAPRATMRLRSDRLAWRDVTVTAVEVSAVADESRLDLLGFSAAVLDGEASGTGSTTWSTGETDLAVSWAALDLDALVRLAGATPQVRPAGVTSGSATWWGTATDPAAGSLRVRTTVGAAAAAPAGRLALPGTSELEVDEGRWRLTAAHRLQNVPVRATLGGTLVSTRLAASTVNGTVTIEETDLRNLVDLLYAAGAIDERPDVETAGQIDADVSLSGTFEQPRVAATIRGTGLAAGPVSDVSAEIAANGTLEELALDAHVRQGVANIVMAAGTLFPRAERFDARLTGRLEDLAALDLPLDGNADLVFDLAGPFAAPAAEGTVSIDEAAYEGFQLGRLDATLMGNRDAVRMTVLAPDFSARGRADVAFTGARVASVELEVDDAEIERLIEDTAAPVPVRGRIAVVARGEAPLDDWQRGRADVELTRLDAVVGNLPVSLAGAARATYADEILQVERFDARLGDLRLFVSGRLGATEEAPAVPASDALRALLVGDISEALAAVRATGLTDLPDASGRGSLALVARVTGSAARPDLAADLDLADGELTFAGYPPVRAVTMRAQLAEGWIQPLAMSAEWQGSRVTVDARVPLRLLEAQLPENVARAVSPTTGPAVITARATSITPSILAPFTDPETLAQIEGAADAAADIRIASADAAGVEGEVRLDRLEMRIAGLPIAQREPTRVTLGGGVARVASWDWSGQGATLGVQGEVRLADREAALLSAGTFDLRLLTPFVRDAGLSVTGTLTPRISIAGDIAAPRIDGEVVLKGGEARLRDPRVVATGLNAFAVLSPQQIRMTELSGVVNGGALSATGQAEYGGDGPAGARITGTIAGMGLELPEGLRSELNVETTIALEDAPGGPAGSVTGTVTVLRSAYRQPLAVVTQLLSALRTERLAATAAPAASDAFASRMALDVRVLTDSDIVVDNNLARLELGGDLRIIGTVAAPAISGRATLREGGQLFLGRNIYTIQEGSTIDFADPVTIVPELNVAAATRAGGVDIDLTLTGTPENLEPILSAPGAPELGQADIVFLLLTGRTLDRVPGAEAQIVGEQVVGYLSGDVLGLAGRAVGLDTIRLGGPEGLRDDPAAIAAETDPTSRLTFGKSIGRDIDLTYSQSLRQGGAQTWIVDYQPLRQINLRLVARDDNLRAYEFRHDIAIGGGERRAGVTREVRESRVVEVTIDGDTALPEAELRRVLRLERGDRFDFSEWQRDRDRLEERLWNDGRLEARVAAERSERDDGVVLTYVVTAGPRTVIAISGYQPSSATRQQLEQAWAQSLFDDFLLEEAGTIVRAALGNEGYLEAQVTAEVTGTDPRTLAVTVDPGPRAVARRIEIEADDPALARDLETWLRARRLQEWRVPGEIEEALTAELRRRGHVQARVAAGEPRIADRTAVLPVEVAAGPVFTIGETTFAGRERLPLEQLQDATGLVTGDPYDPAEIEAARGRVEAAYRRAGFASARAAVVGVDTGAVAVPVVFSIEEGPRQVLREISVRGNRGIGTEVIIRALDLEPGEPLPADAWLRARARLFDTGLFRRVDIGTEPLGDVSDTGERPMQLVATVEEWPVLRLRYGFRVAEERPEEEIGGRRLRPGLSGDVTRRTLFGRAVTVGAAAEYHRRERLGRIFMSAPTLFGTPIESLLTLERSRRNFADASFVTDLSGVSWEQRTRLWDRRLQLSYAYRFNRDHTFQTELPDDPFSPIFDVTANVARLTGSVVWDTRDDPTDATRGLLLSSSIEAAPESLGSDFQFLRHVGQGYYFRSWGRLVFASAGQIGTVAPRGDQALLPNELFFGGGFGTVRGVVEEGLGPVTFFGDPAGGRALVVLNQEVRFPIYGWLRGVGFVDAGNVFETPGDIGFRSLVTSMGAGLRLATPFALLRADWAHVVASRPDADRIVRWTFGIGHSF